MVPFWGRCPPILVYFSEDWDVHWGYRILTYGHIFLLLESPKVAVCLQEPTSKLPTFEVHIINPVTIVLRRGSNILGSFCPHGQTQEGCVAEPDANGLKDLFSAKGTLVPCQ